MSGRYKSCRARRTVPLHGRRVDEIGSTQVEREAGASCDGGARSQLRNGWWWRRNGKGGTSGSASTRSRIGNGEESRTHDGDIGGRDSCLQLGTGNKSRG